MNNSLYQLVVFVPDSHLEEVKNALFNAGAGKFKNYDKCSFESAGSGQFRPLKNSNPHIGTQGQIEKVKEYRVEMLCLNSDLDAIRHAIKCYHPYEEPAYHFIPVII